MLNVVHKAENAITFPIHTIDFLSHFTPSKTNWP